MKRLTKSGTHKYVHCNIDDGCTGKCGLCKRNTEIRAKLKYYEDLEEKGRLIEFPCNIGDKVYIPIDFQNKVYEGKCVSFLYSETQNCWICKIITEGKTSYEKLSDFGMVWFTSKVEAERVLKEENISRE